MIMNRLHCKATKGGNTFGGRIKAARDARGFTQEDVIKRLKTLGIGMSAAAFSKLETSETKRVHVDLLLAISQILSADIEQLVTGVAPTTPAPIANEDAHVVGALMDAMLPRSRRMLTAMARDLSAADQETKEKDVRIAELLQDGISAMEQRPASNGHSAEQLPLPKILPARQQRQLA